MDDMNNEGEPEEVPALATLTASLLLLLLLLQLNNHPAFLPCCFPRDNSRSCQSGWT